MSEQDESRRMKDGPTENGVQGLKKILLARRVAQHAHQPALVGPDD